PRAFDRSSRLFTAWARRGAFWRTTGSTGFRGEVHGTLQGIPPHRSGHHRLPLGAAAGHRHDADCDRAPETCRVLRAASTPEDPETADRDSFDGGIRAVAHLP